MSSRSSTDRLPVGVASIASRLRAAFTALALDVPTVYERIVARLGSRRVRISVDDEVFDVVVEIDVVRVGSAAGDASVTIVTSREAVVEVLNGRRTVVDALHDGTLRATAPLRDLVAVLEALQMFVHGAVRSRTVAQLFHEFQQERVA